MIQVRWGLSRALVLVAIALPAFANAQTRTEIIRGTVVSDSGKPVADASVIATRAPDRAIFQARADAGGRFALTIADGTGDYLVHISAAGYSAFRKRVTRAPNAAAADSVFVVEAMLTAPVAQQLQTVTVKAAKAKPVRFRDPGTGVGASESFVDDFSAGIPPDLAGDLAGAASTLPGFMPTSGGVSVLGLDPSQNNATLNGMAFDASSIPRGARTSTRVSTGAYDPARGWFGGSTTNVEFSGGGVFRLRDAFATLDAPALQASDRLSRGLGQRVTGGNVSYGAMGPIDKRDQFFYSYGVQAGRSVSDVTSLLSASPAVLQNAGVVIDSVARLRAIMDAIGLRGGAIPDTRTTDDVRLLARFDFDPKSVQSLQDAKRTAALTLFGNWQRMTPVGLSVTSTPLSAARQTNMNAGAQAMWSTYFGKDYLATVRSSFSTARDRGSPYAVLPSASVLLASSLDGNDGSVNVLGVGGGAPPGDARRYTWETIGETQLYVNGIERHRVTGTVDARLDGVSRDGASGDRASFAFNSLADLAAGTPVSYRRVSGTPSRSGGVWNAFASVGDLWRVSRTFRVQYGARVEANAYTSRPAANTGLENTFGVRSDVAPNTFHVSPRLGFTWTRRDPGNAGAITFNPLGGFNMRPTSYIRGGIGEFRSIMPAGLLSEASVYNGLPGRARLLTCLGDAVPSPDWAAYLASPSLVPSACADGTPPALADNAPAVRLVSRDYTAPRSWRANLAYESRFHWLQYSVEGTYSLNLDQTGRTDLNFSGTPAFVTAGEGRPVFAPSGSIVTGSGTVPLAPSRVASAFGSVLMTHSDLRSTSRQLIATFAPGFNTVRNSWMQLSYVLGESRAQSSGFDGSTFGSPLAREWTRGPFDARHQLLLRGGYSWHGYALTFFGRFASGVPFTPLVNGDVNGDGFANDRAVVSGNTIDASLAHDINALTAASAPARRCIDRLIRTHDAAASCEGSWTSSLNMALTFAPKFLKVGGRQPNVRLNFTNPLGGLDGLLHGTNGLRGWGSSAAPDPTLFIVRGFDPAARRFRYDLNQGFAKSRGARSLSLAPFRVTLDVRIGLTPDLPRQQLVRYLGAGREGRPGPRLTVPMLHQRYAREVTDPYAAILQLTDSLLLSRAQVDSLQQLRKGYRQTVDSVWTDLATAFAALPEKFDVSAAVARQEHTIEDVRELTRLSVRAALGGILDPVQLRLMPAYVIRYYLAEKPLTQNGRTFYTR